MSSVTLAILFAVVLSSCIYSTSDRAEELANATPTVPPAAEPETGGTPQPSVVGPPDDGEPGAELAEDPVPGWVIVQNVDNSVNVRSGPGTDNDVITRADLGTTLVSTGLVAVLDDAQWVEVVLDEGTTGWVHSNFVGTTAQPTPTPLPTPTPAATGNNLIVDQPNGLGLRAEPAASSPVIRRIDDGTVVIPTGRTSVDDNDRNWTEIRDGAETGWVNARFLKSPST